MCSYCEECAPSYWNFRDAIGKGPSTLPRPNALPDAAWKACGDMGIRTLMLIDPDLRNGGDPDADFNTSSMAFLVKGEDDHDAIAVLRAPLSTRPLGMKNSDNEIIVSANCS